MSQTSTPAGSGESFSALSLGASITVKDIQASLKWYSEVLGFDVDQKFEREGVLRSVRVRAGNVGLMLNQDDGKKGWDREKAQGLSFMITTAQDIDAIANRAKANGGVLDREPTDMPWGARVFQLKDPDGLFYTISSERKPTS